MLNYVWLGLMRLAERGGLVTVLARVLRPVLCWLFPEGWRSRRDAFHVIHCTKPA